MTKKQYTVLKSVKRDGVEFNAGEDVDLEPGQAERLLGTFVEEKAPMTQKANAAASSHGVSGNKGGKGTDGL